MDPERPIVVRDMWLGADIALCYLPVHCLRAALVSQFVVVVGDFTTLSGRPFDEITSAWGWRTWLSSRDQTPRLLIDLGLPADLVNGVLIEVDRALAAPVRRG